MSNWNPVYFDLTSHNDTNLVKFEKSCLFIYDMADQFFGLKLKKNRNFNPIAGLSVIIPNLNLLI